MVRRDPAVEGRLQGGDLAPEESTREVGELRRILLPCDEGLDHRAS